MKVGVLHMIQKLNARVPNLWEQICQNRKNLVFRNQEWTMLGNFTTAQA